MSPRRPSSSFGLIAVSTMAMVFAVSSSLLLFSAHRYRMRDDRVMVPATAVERPRARPQREAPASPSQAAECKAPVYRGTGDGKTEVTFEQCPARPFQRR
jgi:hypothetical protein